ncbi:MAG TPA: integrase core domain-containing protein [Ktedonobacteraceae bacterium]|nr:integrase core domain-containing protein [Ktedonobacteraceae bacterium]
MEAQWQADRSALRELMQTRPDLTLKAWAQRVGRSYSWTKKWAKRLNAAPPNDLAVLCSHSRAHTTPYHTWDALVKRRIEQIRLLPPEGLQRTPGPKAIAYYLSRDAELAEQGCPLPRSTSTIWKLLRHLGLIATTPSVHHHPEPLREPLDEVQVDFKDVSTVRPDPSGEGKKQHVVEVCHFVDAGTSILLSAQAHEDFHAETALEAVIQFLRVHGRPRQMSFDHDPRWVGSSSGWDFPSALRRFLLCVQVEPRLCPPHQPQKNAYVERYHRSYKEECLNIYRPESLEEVKRVTEAFQHHYNSQRPHQGRACGNLPPRQAFPTLPTLPPLPRTVQADRWLWRYCSSEHLLVRLARMAALRSITKRTTFQRRGVDSLLPWLWMRPRPLLTSWLERRCSSGYPSETWCVKRCRWSALSL